jgi:hypothetical protein
LLAFNEISDEERRQPVQVARQLDSFGETKRVGGWGRESDGQRVASQFEAMDPPRLGNLRHRIDYNDRGKAFQVARGLQPLRARTGA